MVKNFKILLITLRKKIQRINLIIEYKKKTFQLKGLFLEPIEGLEPTTC